MVMNVMNNDQATPLRPIPLVNIKGGISGSLHPWGSRKPTKAAGEDVAVLMSGGIGDYLHYIARFDSLLKSSGIDPRRIVVFVESTVPHDVMSLFATALPEVPVRFTPGQIQWTRAHPLLDVLSTHDRMNRPAYHYVKALGFRQIIDWFLPFCCDACEPSPRRLHWLLGESPSVDAPASIVVSLRDKGFLWWPSREICLHLRDIGRSLGLPVRFLGTAVEKPAWLPEMFTAPNALEALRIAASARLLIATDTGLTTVRELMHRPSVYCINRYWHHDVMMRYGYLSDRMLELSGSVVAYDAEACLKAVDRLVARMLPCPGKRTGA
ncbi:MAG: hypothetical protein QOK29_780 [Rhodospirillaceae bacterium]|jgi:hypothetical protein|nr:hypothetical protein [Rhodospirillaceae bacterium]